MIIFKKTGSFTVAGVVSAIAASLCCITPVIALLAGSSSIAANFSWIEPARPYLMGLSIIVLAFAWYVKLKPAKRAEMDCSCETTKKASFLQSKTFLGLVTVFAILMMAFPLYAKMFYPKPKVHVVTIAGISNNQQVKFNIQGMTCAGCEEHVNNELSKVMGVLAYKTSYDTRSSLVTFEGSKVDVKTIEAAINKTGYKVNTYDVMKTSNPAISFYQASLDCKAASNTGCASKAKFMLADLENDNEWVEGAWVNKTGTIVAVKWMAGAGEREQAQIISTVGSRHHIELTPIALTGSDNYDRSLSNKHNWFNGKEVDQLPSQGSGKSCCDK